jgi:Glycosyl transferases group 1
VVSDGRLRSSLGRFDRWLCGRDLRETTLNWRGRLIERVVNGAARLRRAIVYPRACRCRCVPSLKQSGRVAIAAVNYLCFAAYWIVFKLRGPRTQVKSVLQFSIISHKPYMLSRVLRRHGIKSEYFALNVGPKQGILDMGYDYALPATIEPRRRRLLEVFYLWTVLARYDVIHSHFKTLLSHTGWEFEFLKRLGKVIVFHYRGCDIRHRSLNMRLQPALNCCQECDYPVGSCDTEYQRSQVAITTKYGDLFFVTTPDLADFVPRAEHIPFIQPMGVDLAAIEPAPRPANVFRVVTSSNHPGIDGTRFIQAAVQRLRGEGRAIELIEIRNMPYRDALAVYKSADVFVGKLRMGYYNNANIETLMLGVPNMSHIREEYRSLVPDSPIVPTTPDQVYDRLSYYLDHPDELRAIGGRGPAFVRAHHDPDRIVKRIINRYNEALHNHSAGPTLARRDTIPLLRGDLTPIASRK